MLGYLPFGFLCAAALYPRLRAWAALAVAVAGGALLSILLEAAQTYLPARVATNVDVAANAAGALAGAVLAVALGRWLLRRDLLRRMRLAAFAPGAAVDWGLVVVALWLFVQLNPSALLFSPGDLRDLFAVPPGPPRAPVFFVSIEAMSTAANLGAVALLVSLLAAPGLSARAAFLAVVACAVAVKCAAFAVARASALAWLTTGAQEGLLGGLALGWLLIGLPRQWRLVLAIVLLMAGTVLVNLAPANPYLAATLREWQQGHFLNFNGVTRLAAALWPFLCAAYLVLMASPSPRRN